MPPDIDALAREVLAAADAPGQIEPFSRRPSGLTLEDAERISARIAEMRAARGEGPVGWKIGFTNRTIWQEYGVHAPIRGPMYDSTVRALDREAAECVAARYAEPRIEPEIAVRFARAPEPGMDEAALLACLDAVTHGFEIVQSIFPGWRFAAADTVAAMALHGGYWHGPWLPVRGEEHARWMAGLSSFEIVLSRDGEEIDRGAAADVLGGPLSALAHFIDGLADDPSGRTIAPGDIVTTGTVTRAFPVAPGETWQSRVEGLPLAGLTLHVV